MFMKKQEYIDFMNSYRGSYSVMLTTNGTDYQLEHDNGNDKFGYDFVPIWFLTCDADWPTFTSVEKRRRLVKRGFRGDTLKQELYKQFQALNFT